MILKKIFLIPNLLFVIILIATPGCLNTTNRTELWLVPHGQTDWNLEKKSMGHKDVPLNKTGTQQAQATANYFFQEHQAKPFSAIYSSDLSRAHATAQAIAHKLNLAVHDDTNLREGSGGIFEGYTHQEIRQKFPDVIAHLDKDPTFLVPGAETKEQVTKRVVEALKELVKKNQGKRIIVVTHGGCLNKISRWVKNNFAQQAPRHIDPENASISLISVTNDKWKIENWAQTNHLKKDEQSNENTTKQISPVSSTSI